MADQALTYPSAQCEHIRPTITRNPPEIVNNCQRDVGLKVGRNDGLVCGAVRVGGLVVCGILAGQQVDPLLGLERMGEWEGILGEERGRVHGSQSTPTTKHYPPAHIAAVLCPRLGQVQELAGC